MNYSKREKTEFLEILQRLPRTLKGIVEGFLNDLGRGTDRTPREIDQLKFDLLFQLGRFPGNWNGKKSPLVLWLTGQAGYLREEEMYDLAAEMNALAMIIEARWGK